MSNRTKTFPTSVIICNHFDPFTDFNGISSLFHYDFVGASHIGTSVLDHFYPWHSIEYSESNNDCICN